MNSVFLINSFFLPFPLGISQPGDDPTKATSIYEFTVKDTYLKDVSLETFKGNVVLIVNIASHCGLAKNQYAKMMELSKKYHEKGKICERF